MNPWYENILPPTELETLGVLLLQVWGRRSRKCLQLGKVGKDVVASGPLHALCPACCLLPHPGFNSKVTSIQAT